MGVCGPRGKSIIKVDAQIKLLLLLLEKSNVIIRFPHDSLTSIKKEQSFFILNIGPRQPKQYVINRRSRLIERLMCTFISYLIFFSPYYFFFMLVSYSSHSAPLSDLQFDLHTIFNLFLSISATARAPCGVHQLFFIQNRFFFPL